MDDQDYIADWKYEVANGDTVLGFHEWKKKQIEIGREDAVQGAVDAVVDQLTRDDLAYALDVARGEYRGFAALHDRMDANMLLSYVLRTTEYRNRVMDAFNRRFGISPRD